MKITKAWLKSHNACSDGMDWMEAHDLFDKPHTVILDILQEEYSLGWWRWLAKRVGYTGFYIDDCAVNVYIDAVWMSEVHYCSDGTIGMDTRPDEWTYWVGTKEYKIPTDYDALMNALDNEDWWKERSGK